jgi:dihydroorotase
VDFLIKNISVVNEGEIQITDVILSKGKIFYLGRVHSNFKGRVIDGTGKYLLPGVIDAQVHFRDPGLTHKGDLFTETKAAVAGGVTSFIDMPNTFPQVLSMSILEEKYKLASQKSLANFGFFLGVTKDNLQEVIQTATSDVLAVSDDGLYFSKKGNLLADHPETMEEIFKNCKTILAIHSENEQIITQNEEKYREIYGNNVPVSSHPLIRSEEACYEATKRAVSLANKYQAKLHILHLSTVNETHLFRNDIPLKYKNITTEVSVHHLWFSDQDYQKLGTLIKWNPSIKTENDKKGLLQALIDDKIDIVTSDHAPHTLEEKNKPYFESMSGAPIVQFSLNIMFDFYQQGLISLEKVVEKMCHNPAILYKIEKRGFIKEGFYADLTIVDPNATFTVNKDVILSKCGWSPLEGTTFRAKVSHTFVNGNLVFEHGKIFDSNRGMPLVKQKINF